MPRPLELSGADAAGSSPRLSLILCSRNDSWQGNPLWRLQTTLNYIAAEAEALGRLNDLEIVVADWGSQQPLRDAVELTEPAARIVRYLTISPEIALAKQKDSPFTEVIAINAAARRSRGDFIGRIDQDTLVGRRFLLWFFSALDSGRAPFPIETTALISNRRRIPYDFAKRCLSLDQITRYVRTFRPWLPTMPFLPPKERFWQCYIGILLMHRSLWEAAGGYDETFIYYGFMEFDFFLRLRMQYQSADLGLLVDWDFFHLDHAPAWRVETTVNRKLNVVRTPSRPPPVFCPNGEGWGLAEMDIPVECGTPLARPAPTLVSRAAEACQFALATISSTLQTLVRIQREPRESVLTKS